MLKWLFGDRKPRADRENDEVWATGRARVQGVVRKVAALTGTGRSVVVVANSIETLEELSRALAIHRPVRCTDLFGQAPLRATIAKPGSLVIALGSALPMEGSPAAGPVDVIVIGRNDVRTADEAIVRFTDSLGAEATVAFLLALDDALLVAFSQQVGPMLQKLGMGDDEPITHALVTRAVERAQQQRGRGRV
jgi:preprotein translocase subunit SecA